MFLHKKYYEALSAYKKSIKMLGGEIPENYIMLSKCLYERGEIKKAVDAFVYADDIYPGSMFICLEATLNILNIYLNLEECESAKIIVDRLVEYKWLVDSDPLYQKIIDTFNSKYS